MKDKSRQEILTLIKRYPVLGPLKGAMIEAVELIIGGYEAGRKLLVCGNGGSASDALHIVGELMKSFAMPRKLSNDEKMKFYDSCNDADYITSNLEGYLPAISLVNEIAFMSAYANDRASDMIFAQQVYGIGNKGDILLAISTSGNSDSIKYACEVANAIGMYSIGLTGKTGGELAHNVDILLNAPETETFKIQELHLPIYHAMCLAIECEFFQNDNLT